MEHRGNEQKTHNYDLRYFIAAEEILSIGLIHFSYEVSEKS